MQFQLRVDDKEARRYLKKMPKQVPFAVSTALNETAFDIRRHQVRSVWPASVGAKARGFAGRAFRVLKSSKRKLLSAVFADPRRVSPEGIEAIKRVEEGKTHFPFRGRFLAVPTRNALTPTGRVKKVAREALQDNSANTFVANRMGRGPAIWQRTPKGLKMLFVLKPKVPTPKVFPFGREALRIARLVWPGALFRAVRKAERTAR